MLSGYGLLGCMSDITGCVLTLDKGEKGCVHLFLIVKCSKPVVAFVSCTQEYKEGEFNF